MKNVYFVQVDVSASIGAPSAYLPYTAGVLAAAAWQSETVREAYRFKEFIFLREDVREVVARLDDPAFCAFSNYCWNTEYNKRLACEIKKAYPDCIVAFGGHNVPDSFSFLEDYPYIDYLCHGEGENTVRTLMEALALGTPAEDVPNISYRLPGGGYRRTRTVCQKALDFPSPYLDGWFDTILRQHPEFSFNAILETSRGCPHQCAYCDWGLLKSKVRLFPLDRVKAEIRWMSEHKIAFIWGADANFGLFSRDLEIADALIEAKETSGFPERMRINYAKNNFENVFTIVKKFKECDFDRFGATLSFQSLSPAVLKNIGRSNAELEFYKNLLTMYTAEGMHAYSELILGLPGETYESFIRGVGTLFEIGQHFMFEVYHAILLPNSLMGQPEYVERFGIKTVRTELIRAHFAMQKNDIPEYCPIVVETNTLPRDMWVRASTFFVTARAYHCLGLLRAFDVYLHVERGVPYERFYDGMIDFFEENPDLLPSKLYFNVKRHAQEQSEGKAIIRMTFGPCGDVIWSDHEYTLLHILEQQDRFFEEIEPYLRRFDIPGDVFDDLLLYSRNLVRTPLSKESVIDLKYDVHGFLTAVYDNQLRHLQKRPHKLRLSDSDHKTNWVDYGKYVLWYGRMGWSTSRPDISYID